jgi:hypothetical protein
MKTTTTLLLIAIIVLSSCSSPEPTAIPVTPVNASLVSRPCDIFYSDAWNYVAGAQVEEASGEIVETVRRLGNELAQQEYPPPIKSDEKRSKIYLLHHPIRSDVLFVEYDFVFSAMRYPDTFITYLLRRDNNGWAVLNVPNVTDCCVSPKLFDIDLVGFVNECNGLSLYIAMRSTVGGIASSGGVIQGWRFLQTRDDGKTWWNVNAVFADRPIFPEGAYYNLGTYQGAHVTFYAWYPISRTLYATSRLWTPTPRP